MHSHGRVKDARCVPGLGGFGIAELEPFESQARGFQHGHRKVYNIPATREHNVVRLFREKDSAVLHNLLQDLRQALIRCAESLQYEASTLPAAQMGQSVLPEKDSSQPEDTADGESASQSSIWTTKWSYNEEFRPKWVWDEWRGCWAKLHPCRCLRGPRICLGYAVKYDLFLCKNCHARTVRGEVHDRCTCTCDGCSGPPTGNPGPALVGEPAHDDHVSDGGEELDGTLRQRLETTAPELPGHHVQEHRRAHADQRPGSTSAFATSAVSVVQPAPFSTL